MFEFKPLARLVALYLLLAVVVVLMLAAVVVIAVSEPASYDRAIANVLKSEGGYTNDRADPGGPTNWGITIYDARKYWKPGATAADVRAMPLAAAKQIYRTHYWNALRADELCAGLDYTVFDYGVNSGIARVGKVLRRKLGMPTSDWHVTDEVIERARGRGEQAHRPGDACDDLIEGVNAERCCGPDSFLRNLHIWSAFGRGWSRRVTSVRNISLAMASAGPLGLIASDLKAAYGPGKAYAVPGLDDDDPPQGVEPPPVEPSKETQP